MKLSLELVIPQCSGKSMDHKFSNDVYKLVKSIPRGKLMTYGQIAALCGHPGAARVVGQIAHFGPNHLPWHRVVNKTGKLASGFVPDGRQGQQKLLEQEGVIICNNVVEGLFERLWYPQT